MRNKKLLTIAGAILLVSVLLVSIAGAAETDAETEAAYTWTSYTSSYVAEFINYGSGYGTRATTYANGVISQYGASYGYGGTGFRGYNHYDGYGVYGRAPNGLGVYGQSANNYAGYFWSANGVGVRAYTDYGPYGAHISNYADYGYGIYAYTSGNDAYGVYAYSGDYIGVYGQGYYRGGYFVGAGSGAEGVRGYTSYSGGDGVNGYATGSYGYAVDAYASGYSGIAVDASAYGDYGYGVNGYAGGTYAYAGNFNSYQYRAMYVDGCTNDSCTYYDIYVNDYAYIAGTTFGPIAGNMSFMARNDGAEALNPGDLVVFKGFDDQALGTGAALVAKANSAGGAIVGIVQGAYVIDGTSPEAPPAFVEQAESAPGANIQDGVVTVAPAAPVGEEAVADEYIERTEKTVDVDVPAAQPPNGSDIQADPYSGQFVETAAEPGMFVQVLFQGLTQISVKSDKPIAAGDFVVARPNGMVTSAPKNAYSTAMDRGWVVLGRALEDLASGSGQVYVQVNLR